ncbi:MAG TPA: NAD(P)-dependent oxidoreductase [Egibacteraceae bacterium]|nr:NAD(P)-dependent oxidoreductase [Egibacteraceae bacterium]
MTRDRAPARTRVLLTGAAGGIGTVLRAGLRGRYPELRLLDTEAMDAAGEGEEVVVADLRDYANVEAAMEGVDAVVHLAAIPGEAAFAEICAHNLVATYHVFEAARRQGATRVVYASSNHAIGFTPVTERIGPDAPLRPDTYYGVSKAFGEALGRLYVDKFGMDVACLRIGSFGERPGSRRELFTWLSPRDAVELVGCCLDAPYLGFAIVYGISANTRTWWDNPEAERIGYRPVDDAEAFAAELLAGPASDDPTERFQGGPFTGRDTTADHPPGVPPRGG